jgi:hypothetical protein
MRPRARYLVDNRARIGALHAQIVTDDAESQIAIADGHAASNHAHHGMTMRPSNVRYSADPDDISAQIDLDRSARLMSGDGPAATQIGYVRAPPTWTAVTPSDRAGRHRASRHGRRWADPAGRRLDAVAPRPEASVR